MAFRGQNDRRSVGTFGANRSFFESFRFRGLDEREFGRRQRADPLRESFEIESDAGSLFVLLLLHPLRFLGEQLAERQIRFTQSVRLGRVDVIANEAKNVDPPVVPLGFVRTHLVRQQRLLFSLLLGVRACSCLHRSA